MATLTHSSFEPDANLSMLTYCMPHMVMFVVNSTGSSVSPCSGARVKVRLSGPIQYLHHYATHSAGKHSKDGTVHLCLSYD